MRLWATTLSCAATLLLLGACAETGPAEDENDNPEANARPIPICGDEKTESGEDCDDGTPITCDDANFCTEDICHPATDNTYECSNDLIDEDGDGFAAGDCPEKATPGGDCDDHNNRVRPDQEAHYLLGYGEYLDNFDYNCDGEETWDDDTLCSSADCCEFWQDSFMNSDFEFPACGSSAPRMTVCMGTSSYSQIARPCH